MKQFLSDYAEILAPVLVAVVSGIFYLLKRGGNSRKQLVHKNSDCNIVQIGSNATENGDIRIKIGSHSSEPNSDRNNEVDRSDDN